MDDVHCIYLYFDFRRFPLFLANSYGFCFEVFFLVCFEGFDFVDEVGPFQDLPCSDCGSDFHLQSFSHCLGYVAFDHSFRVVLQVFLHDVWLEVVSPMFPVVVVSYHGSSKRFPRFPLEASHLVFFFPEAWSRFMYRRDCRYYLCQ